MVIDAEASISGRCSILAKINTVLPHVCSAGRCSVLSCLRCVSVIMRVGLLMSMSSNEPFRLPYVKVINN